MTNAWILNSEYFDKSIKKKKWVDEEELYESEFYPKKGIREAYGPLFKGIRDEDGLDFYIGFKKTGDKEGGITNDMFA